MLAKRVSQAVIYIQLRWCACRNGITIHSAVGSIAVENFPNVWFQRRVARNPTIPCQRTQIRHVRNGWSLELFHIIWLLTAWCAANSSTPQLTLHPPIISELSEPDLAFQPG